VVDTNVFVAAVKPFSKPAPDVRKGTKTLNLLVKLITDERLEIIGNSRLVAEYSRLAEELDSKTTRLILQQLAAKMETIEVSEEASGRCRPYLPKRESADVIHAATCLQAKAILITNDANFDRIRKAGVIEVWSISEAIRRM
jgi:predicted nucleic acid-binding protein